MPKKFLNTLCSIGFYIIQQTTAIEKFTIGLAFFYVLQDKNNGTECCERTRCWLVDSRRRVLIRIATTCLAVYVELVF